MRQQSTEPEYSVVESERIPPMESGPVAGKVEYIQVVADLVELLLQVKSCTEALDAIHTNMALLVQSVSVRE